MEARNFLRGWLTVTTIATLGNCYQCFTNDYFLTSKLYDLIYRPEVSALYRRLFLSWQFYLVLMQVSFICHFDSSALYWINVANFAAVFVHFASETFLFKTASLNMGIIVNLTVSSLTVLLLIVAWNFLNKPKVIKENFNTMQKTNRKRPKVE